MDLCDPAHCYSLKFNSCGGVKWAGPQFCCQAWSIVVPAGVPWAHIYYSTTQGILYIRRIKSSFTRGNTFIKSPLQESALDALQRWDWPSLLPLHWKCPILNHLGLIVGSLVLQLSVPVSLPFQHYHDSWALQQHTTLSLYTCRSDSFPMHDLLYGTLIFGFYLLFYSSTSINKGLIPFIEGAVSIQSAQVYWFSCIQRLTWKFTGLKQVRCRDLISRKGVSIEMG